MNQKELLSLKDREEVVKKKAFDLALNLVKNFGDLAVAGQACGLPAKMLGVNFNDGVCGLGGLISASITCY